MSYWDWLPAEIKESIIQLTESQLAHEQRRQQILSKVNKEIGVHWHVQEARGLGGLRLQNVKNILRISGYYKDEEG